MCDSSLNRIYFFEKLYNLNGGIKWKKIKKLNIEYAAILVIF